MSFDPASLLVSMVAGLIGFALFVYGKKQGRVPHLVVGIALSVYPWFVPNLILQVCVGLLLIGGLMLAVQRGL